MNKRKVIIIGGSYYGNRGAALMLKGTIQKIQKEFKDNVIIDVWAEHAQKNQELCDDKDVNIIQFSPIKFVCSTIPNLLINKLLNKKINNKDVDSNSILSSSYSASLFVDISGISFIDDRSIVYLFYDFLVTLPAIVLGKPYLKLAQALGPFKKIYNRILAKIILPRITQIYARGVKTLENCNRIGLKNVKLAADVGFAVETPVIPDIKAKFKGMKEPVIGLSVSSVVYNKCVSLGIDYIDILNKLVEFINNNYNASVILIPHAIRDTDKLKNNDIPVIKKLLEKNNKDYLYFFESIHHPYEIRSLISGCEFIIISRFHAMVNALALGVPVYVMGWSHKYQEVLDMFEVGDVFETYNNMRAENVISTFDRLYNQREALKQKIKNKKDDVFKLANLNFEHFNEILS